MTYPEVTAKLQRLGCREIPRRSGGSHRKRFTPTTGQATVMPDWGAKAMFKNRTVSGHGG